MSSAASQPEFSVVRRAAAVILAIAAVPVVMLGLFDPLEGGMALLASAVPLLLARLLSRVPFPALLAIPYAVAVVTGASAIGVAVALPDQEPLILRLLLAAYELSVGVAIVGSVVNAVTVVRRTRPGADPAPPPPAHR